MDKTNKYGLSRYISECVKEKIRKDAGYGCVFCGALIIQYEHIEPEFSNAQIHDPEKMTLLCANCHFKVTKKLISKKAVWDAKSSPKAKQKGFVNDFIYHDCDNTTIQIGSSKISMSNIVLEAYGKPLLWFEESKNKEEPFKLCCIFYDKESNPIAFINRNEFIGIVGSHDIKSVGTKIEIKNKVDGGILNLSCEGGDICKITSMSMNYIDLSIRLEKDGVILVEIG
ncbi:HNH endonuclease, partial [Yersinia aleksiciae]|uniref:HNH endonuclease n=1 Tax=Yersinia aleksiciae TaxID=263819 RepID=UPI0011A57127